MLKNYNMLKIFALTYHSPFFTVECYLFYIPSNPKINYHHLKNYKMELKKKHNPVPNLKPL